MALPTLYVVKTYFWYPVSKIFIKQSALHCGASQTKNVSISLHRRIRSDTEQPKSTAAIRALPQQSLNQAVEKVAFSDAWILWKFYLTCSFRNGALFVIKELVLSNQIE